MDSPFTRHPAQVGEGYGAHLVAASLFAARLFGAALACLVHAVFPFLCASTGSEAVRRLHRKMAERNVHRGG